jgi:putative molybdopterin biosynthesis protein
MAAHGTRRTSLERARAAILEHAVLTGVERIATEHAAGRVLAEPVFARHPAPHYRASAMDGIAVRAAETARAAQGAPVVLEAVGDEDASRRANVCWPVDTGSALPAWADAVVRIEDVKRASGGFEVRAPVVPGRDVRRIGEDIEAGAAIVGRGRTLGPNDIGALLATGVAHVEVRRPPRIGVLATGSEVVEPADVVPAPGQVIEFNSRVLASYARTWGAETAYLGRAGEDEGELTRTVSAAVAAHDAMCVIAGSSAGSKDTSVAALERCGRLLFHGVEVMPGGPAAAAVVEGKPVFVVPGYPVSAVVVYRELVRPWIDAVLGRSPAVPASVSGTVRRKITSRLGVEELLRVCLAFDGDDFVVAPLPRGAGSISTLVRAHGLLRIGPRLEGFDAGSRVRVELLEPAADLRRCVVVAGRPEPAASALEDALARRGEPVRFSHLGLARHDALAALRAGEAHLAVFDARDAVADRDVPDGARAMRVGDTQMLASAALLATNVGRQIVEAISSARPAR